MNNFAFIDGQNLYQGVKSLGWKLDYGKFRNYLRQKYWVRKAYMFMGRVEGLQDVYDSLVRSGFELIFKDVLEYRDGTVKGNIDTELVLHAMIDYCNYHRAIIVSSDGDFACLVNYLREQDKLMVVLSPHVDTCSSLLKKSAQGKISFIDDLKKHLTY